MALLDPPEDAVDRTAAPDGFLREWGIDVGNDIVVDASGIGQLLGTDASVPVAAQYPPHAITDRFQLMTAYPLARSVAPVEGGVDGRTAQPLVQTSPQSWAEADIAASRQGGQRRVQRRQGRQARADHARRGRLRAGDRRARRRQPTASPPTEQAGRARAQARIAHGRHRRLGFRRQQHSSASRATATSS